jgi:NAD+ synthase
MRPDIKIAIAQINPIVGDLDYNESRILTFWMDAEKMGAELVIFPELAICGYPPEDLIIRPSFLAAVETRIKSLCEKTKHMDCAALLPSPLREDGKIYNAAFLIDKGQIIGIIRKQYLPNYGVFDECRTFNAAPPQDIITFKGHKLGVMICEDVWHPEPAAHLKKQGAEILIVPNASPFETGKAETRLKITRARVSETGLPLIYVNQIGGQDELVFDGGSFALDVRGEITTQLPFFVEHLSPHPSLSQRERVDRENHETGEGLKTLYAALKLGTHDYVNKNNFPGVLLGLSGGIDSAIVAVIAVDALGADKVHAVMMPSRFTAPESLEDAAAIAKNLNIKYDIIDIEKPLQAFEDNIENLQGLAHENIQSRIRGTILMALSNASGKMLLSTGNKSEMACGYATLYGDMNGGYNPLKDVYKTTVYELSRWRNAQSPIIPERVITRPATAELRDNQTDQDSLPPYDVLDAILKGLIEEALSVDDITRLGHDRAVVERVSKMLNLAEYKRRQAPPGPKVTSRAFGPERRYPMTNGFKSS